MKLNSRQQILLNNQYASRIGPCIREILILAKTEASKKVCVFLVLTALKGSLTRSQYTELLAHHLGDLTKQRWLVGRLSSLNNLFQLDNYDHIFIRPIIAKCYCPPDLNESLEDWIKSSRENIIKEYRSRIHGEINELCPRIFNEVIMLMSREEEAIKEEKVKFAP